MIAAPRHSRSYQYYGLYYQYYGLWRVYASSDYHGSLLIHFTLLSHVFLSLFHLPAALMASHHQKLAHLRSSNSPPDLPLRQYAPPHQFPVAHTPPLCPPCRQSDSRTQSGHPVTTWRCARTPSERPRPPLFHHHHNRRLMRVVQAAVASPRISQWLSSRNRHPRQTRRARE